MNIEKLNDVILIPEKQVGKTVEKKHAQRVKELLGVKNLYIPKLQPGVYCIYFEKDDLVYIGQSGSVSLEITRIKGKSTTQLALNQAIYRNEPNIFAYAIKQGLGCSKKERIELERFFIRKVGKQALNIAENPYGQTISSAMNSNILQPKFTLFKGSWSQFGLAYDNVPWPVSGGCIYIALLHKAMGKFYIGESWVNTSQSMLYRHRYNIRRVQTFRLNNVPIINFKATESMVDTMADSGLEFYFSAIVNLNPTTKFDLRMTERKIRKEAVVDYPQRLFTTPPLGKQEEMLLRNSILRAANLLPSPSVKKSRTEKLPNLPSTFPFPVFIEGKWYVSIKGAARALNVPPDTLRTRLLSPNYANYIWLKDKSGKSFPDNPYINAKEREFNSMFKAALVYYLPQTPKPKKRSFTLWYKENWHLFNTD